VNARVQRVLFAGTSRLTEVVPVFGARLLDSVFRPVGGSRTASAMFARRNRRIMKKVKAFRRFLVIPDIHIGDAVITQSSLTALRDFFPDAQIDYAINKAVAPVIEGNPEATRVMPIFSGGRFPSPSDVQALRAIIRTGAYDLCVCFSPFMEEEDLVEGGQPFVSFLTHGPQIVRNENDTEQINHFSYQGYQFVRGLLSTVAHPVRGDGYRGVRTTYSDEAIEQASRFGRAAGLSPRSPVIMFNPDSACIYNLMPFESQAALLTRLARDTTADTTILLGAGHTEVGIGQRLADAVPSASRSKIRLIPQSTPLEVYSALIDLADVFVSGDTGPLHLAAARRYSRSGRHEFRNRTAVLSFFGATMPRMSGYDSFQPGYLPANQDAPSWCYLAGSPCRNITCLNKLFKTCRTVRCFEHVDVAGLAGLVVSHLDGLTARASVRRQPPAPEQAPALRVPLPT
jgi:ADP-heptose:LPS heptosyltransferase